MKIYVEVMSRRPSGLSFSAEYWQRATKNEKLAFSWQEEIEEQEHLFHEDDRMWVEEVETSDLTEDQMAELNQIME